MSVLPVRHLSRSGLKVTEIGLGCATLGFDAAPEAVSQARLMLNKALNAGIIYFDTAPFYGRGLSERVVGDALRRQPHVISSKVGRLLTPSATASTHMPFEVKFDYTYDGIMRSFEQSLQRLGLSRIDILLAHDLGAGTHGDAHDARLSEFTKGGGLRAMEALRQSGSISAIGLGVNEIAICQRCMEYGDFDLFLLAGRHTLLERTDALPFFDQCAKVGTDIVVGGPFNSGMLVGGVTYNYREIPDDMAARHAVLLDYCRAQNVDIGAAALQFPLRHAQVKSVIPGPKNPQELSEILDWYHAGIPAAFWDGLQDLDRT